MKLTKDQKDFVNYILVMLHWAEWSNGNIISFTDFKKNYDAVEVFKDNEDKYSEWTK